MADGADAFGRALSDWARGETDPETFERDDGYTEAGMGHELYVAGFSAWLSAERRSVRYVRGRVVDVGCAAGRVPLYLQERGYDVVGLDSSALAVRTAAARGVKKTWCLSAEALTPEIGSFDTIVMFGNNFGIFGTPHRTRRGLDRLGPARTTGARILAGSTNPYCGGAPALTRAYYFRNRRRGRMPGQLRLRIRYRTTVGPWFSWLFVSRAEMTTLLRGTGWHLSRVLGGRPSEPYVAVLEKA